MQVERGPVHVPDQRVHLSHAVPSLVRAQERLLREIVSLETVPRQEVERLEEPFMLCEVGRLER